MSAKTSAGVTCRFDDLRPTAVTRLLESGLFVVSEIMGWSTGAAVRMAKWYGCISDPQISIEPSVSINKIDLVQGEFTTKVIRTRTTYTMTTLMFATALVQFNSGNNTVAANVRFQWEYQPGSELFLVYNEQRDVLTPSFPLLSNRAFIVKINRVFRYLDFGRLVHEATGASQHRQIDEKGA